MVITLIIGLVMILCAIIVNMLDNSPKQWNNTIGTITKSEWKEQTSEDSEGNQTIHYKVGLEYRYS